MSEQGNADILVSAIITTYKRPGDILIRAAHSVLNQTYKNIELIVVNDYPVKEYEKDIRKAIDGLKDNRVHYYLNAENKGACYSRNYGAEQAKGSIIAFLDDDDAWEPDKIEKHLNFFEDEDVGLVYAGFRIFANGKVKDILPQVADKEIYPKILLGNCIGGCSVPVIRKKTFFDVKGFDERFLSNQDTDLWIRLCKVKKVVSIQECYTNYYYSQESITRDLSKQLQGYDLILEKYESEIKQFPQYRMDRLAREFLLCVEKGTFKDIFKYYKIYNNGGGKISSIIPRVMKAFVKRCSSYLKIHDI